MWHKPSQAKSKPFAPPHPRYGVVWGVSKFSVSLLQTGLGGAGGSPEFANPSPSPSPRGNPDDNDGDDGDRQNGCCPSVSEFKLIARFAGFSHGSPEQTP